MKFAAIVVAAGRGVRFGRPKQLIEVAGLPLVAWSMRAFAALDEIDDLVVATEPEHLEHMRTLCERYAPRLQANVVAGGATRQESARRALGAVPASCDAAFVHDGARPMIRPEDVRAGMALVAPGRGALIAAPAIDTIKIVEPGTTAVVQTLERARLWSAQTPQFGTLADLLRAHDDAARAGIDATDDAMLLERIGVVVDVVPPSAENFKVTLARDRDLAELILRERALLARDAVPGAAT